MQSRSPIWITTPRSESTFSADCYPPLTSSAICAAPDAQAGRRLVLVDLYWTRDKDPRVPLGHAALLAALRHASILVHSVVIPVNRKKRVARIANQVLAEIGDIAHSLVDIGIGAYIWNERILRKLLPLLRARNFKGRIILGGPQISYVQRNLETLYPQVDVFIRGHAENALVEVMQTNRQVSSAGVHYAGTPDRATQAKALLEQLPSPWLDGFIPLRDQAFLRWETQRGCQFKCAFCQHRQPDAKVKGAVFPLSRIMAEIDEICRAGVKEVAVLDPVFNSNEHPGHAVRVLKRFAQQGYTGRLSLQCRAELIDDAFLDAAQALDVCLEFGLQTIHSKEQGAIERTNNMARVEQALEMVRSRGIRHEVSLIFGLPEQTLDSFKDSVRWCLERKVPVIRAFPLLLLRGTKLDLERDRWNLVVTDDSMPEVVESSTFCRKEWNAMLRISEALNKTVHRHPGMNELLRLANVVQPDRSRFQPDYPRGLA
jgi:radical SAM superfamily enzyme YgiQ (UPF0313 family)